MIDWPDEETQGSQAWLNARKQRVGASEVPIILGISEFMTPYEWWEEKTDRRKPQASNFAMERGIQAEPEIKRLYEAMHGVTLDRFIAKSNKIIPLVASLDGFHRERNAVVEFKYPSREKHEQAKRGIVPEMYLWQVQAQIECADAELGVYVSYDGKEIVCIEVPRDEAKISQIAEAVPKYWNHVVTNTPPPYTDKDCIKLTDDSILESLSTQYIEALRLSEEYDAKAKFIKSQIEAHVPHKKCKFYGLTMQRGTRKGQVNYAAIKQLESVNLEDYRLPSVETVTLKVDKSLK
jgi:putative phage-type endonuclease